MGEVIAPCPFEKCARETGDGHHTLQELYEHRIALFIVLLNKNLDLSWKSRVHDDGSSYPGWFVAGIETRRGMITYHLPDNQWCAVRSKELAKSPKWDGHTPEDVIDRLLTWAQE